MVEVAATAECECFDRTLQNDSNQMANDVRHKHAPLLGLRNDRTVRYFRMAVCSAAFLDLERLPLRSVKVDRRFCARNCIDWGSSCT